MSIFSQLDFFCSLFIRPSRQKYLQYDLGPEFREVDGVEIRRFDFSFQNRRSQNIKASLFSAPKKPSSKCLIYLHCNSGSRIEGIPCLNTAVSLGMSLLVFDFSGSGLSDGEFVTLGFQETDDLEDIVKYCRNKGMFTEFVLWGRSMGAVTALIYGAKKVTGLQAMVVDSAFSSLTKLAIDYGSRMTSLPKFIISPGITILGKSIKNKIGFNVFDMKVVESSRDCRVPVLFITSNNDKLVQSYHAEELYKAYGAPKKQLYYIDSDHNDARKPICINRIRQFILEVSSLNEKTRHSSFFTSSKAHYNVDSAPNNPFKNCKGLMKNTNRASLPQNPSYSVIRQKESLLISCAASSISKPDLKLKKSRSPFNPHPSKVSLSSEFSKLAFNNIKTKQSGILSNRGRSETYNLPNKSVSPQPYTHENKNISMRDVKGKIMREDMKNERRPVFATYNK